MKLSIVIVNYNVKYFLEQCLISVGRAIEGIDAEVYVVDNASVDGSCQMVRQRFPSVNLIVNRNNTGFSCANNQAIRIAKGEYILLLNPDTVVEEDCFRKCIEFMDANPMAGSLGVKMIDGKGRFLPESKRSLPSPSVSFYKIFGLSRLFPKSKVFARYHLGHLDENLTHEIEILPGAFMFMRKSVLDKVGLLDEAFFMYGEDIDLSYRIILGGYRNYYFPSTTIIHYKGESTKKGSINYVLVFYRAMMIFARKHFSRKNASLYIGLIYMAIYFRAFLSIIKRFVQRALQPLLDALIMVMGFVVILPLWEHYRFRTTDAYPDSVVGPLTAIYVIIWLLSNWLTGAYDRPRKVFAAARGIGLGTLIILAGYALLPENMRFSRAIILLNAIWSIVLVQVVHLAVGLYRGDTFPTLRRRKRIAIVGNPREAQRALDILTQAGVEYNLLGNISPTPEITHPEQMATIDRLEDFVRVNRVDEVIFCAGNISSQDIIGYMLSLVPEGVDYKIAPPESLSVIGSNSINTSGDLYTIEISAISKPSNQRTKRIFVVAVAIFVLAVSPVLLIAGRKPRTLAAKGFWVLVGRYTWVGYAQSGTEAMVNLPPIRMGVFSPIVKGVKSDNRSVESINLLYAKNYSILTDIGVLWRNLVSYLFRA